MMTKRGIDTVLVTDIFILVHVVRDKYTESQANAKKVPNTQWPNKERKKGATVISHLPLGLIGPIEKTMINPI